MTAVIETVAGLALVVAPATALSQLFGSGPETAVTLTISRLAGAALLALAAACWLARDDGHVRAARGLVAGMLLYNVGAVVLFAHAGIALGIAGLALWPGVVLHVVMSAWCATCVRPKKAP